MWAGECKSNPTTQILVAPALNMLAIDILPCELRLAILDGSASVPKWPLKQSQSIQKFLG